MVSARRPSVRIASTSAGLVLAGLLVTGVQASTLARPVIASAGASKGHLTARWSLPAGFENDVIEVSTQRRLAADGGFVGFPDFELLKPRQTSWRSRDAYRPGTYYLHISSYDVGGERRWSTVRSARVPGVPLRGGTYRGSTSQGQRIELVANGGVTRVTHLRYGIRLHCGGSSRTVTYDLSGGVAVQLDGTFRGEFVFPPGTAVKGSFRGASASGTLRQNYFDGNLHARCDSGLVRWSARRS